jgi:hypothetical protein
MNRWLRWAMIAALLLGAAAIGFVASGPQVTARKEPSAPAPSLAQLAPPAAGLPPLESPPALQTPPESVPSLEAPLALPPPEPDQPDPSPGLVPPQDFGAPPGFEPPPRLPLEQRPIECDPLASPDYVPGIGVRDREVAPADLPSDQVEIDTQVFLEMRSKNPQLRGTGVIVRIPRLGAPICIPVDPNRRR